MQFDANLPEYEERWDDKGFADAHAYDRQFKSDDNWPGDRESGDAERIANCLRVTGNVIREGVYTGGLVNKKSRQGTLFNPHATAAQIQAHYNTLRVQYSLTFIGKSAERLLRSAMLALGFGIHTFIEGTKGTAKTRAMEYAVDCVLDRDLISMASGTADASDLSLLGGEVPGPGLTAKVVLSCVTKPGIAGAVIDEIRRYSAAASNCLLEATSVGRVTLQLPASGRRDAKIRLAPRFFLFSAANLRDYGGQAANSNAALYDRFGGVLANQPETPERLEIYRRHLDHSLTDWGNAPTRCPLPYTLREAQEAVRHVRICPELQDRLCIAAWAMSPESFRRRTAWTTGELHDAYMRNAQGQTVKARDELRKKVNTFLEEGSGMRAELGALDCARAIALLENAAGYDLGGTRWSHNGLEANELHLAEGLIQACTPRMTPLPGCDGEVPEILRLAVRVFFPRAYQQLYQND